MRLNIFSRRPSKIETFKGKNGWYFRLRASNGRITSDGGQAYSTKSNAKRAARKLYPGLEIIEL